MTRVRVFSSGVISNFIVALIAFSAFFYLLNYVNPCVVVVDSDIKSVNTSSVILKINGITVRDKEDVYRAIGNLKIHDTTNADSIIITAKTVSVAKPVVTIQPIEPVILYYNTTTNKYNTRTVAVSIVANGNNNIGDNNIIKYLSIFVYNSSSDIIYSNKTEVNKNYTIWPILVPISEPGEYVVYAEAVDHDGNIGYNITWFYAIGVSPKQQINLTAGEQALVSVSNDVNITITATNNTAISIAFAEAPEVVSVEELNIAEELSKPQVEVVEYQSITVSGDVQNVSVILMTVEYPEDSENPLVFIYKNGWIQVNNISDFYNETRGKHYNNTYGTIIYRNNHTITLNFTQIANALNMNLSDLLADSQIAITNWDNKSPVLMLTAKPFIAYSGEKITFTLTSDEALQNAIIGIVGTTVNNTSMNIKTPDRRNWSYEWIAVDVNDDTTFTCIVTAYDDAENSNITYVNITVRAIPKLNVKILPLIYTGQSVIITAAVCNEKGTARNVTTEINIDGVEVYNTTIPSINNSTCKKINYSWIPSSNGTYTVTIRATAELGRLADPNATAKATIIATVTVITLKDENGTRSIILPNIMGVKIIGLYKKDNKTYPAERAGIKPGMVIIAINNESTKNVTEFRKFMQSTKPGEVISVKVYHNGSFRTFNVTLADMNGRGFLGVYLQDADYIGGISVAYSSYILESLRNIPITSIKGWIYMIALPINFQGFVGDVKNYFEAPEYVFNLLNAFYWIGWINFYVGLFNCLPAIPLDGGRVFYDVTNRIGGKKIAESFSRFLSALIFFSIILSIVIPNIPR